MDRQPTVFVVDSDPRIWKCLCDLSQAMGLACRTYDSGRDFLDALDASRPGCVVTEVRVTGLNGLQIQRALAAADSTLPVVFLAACATVSVAVQAMRDGAMHFLEKPFREHEMWDAIQEAIRLDAQRRRERARLQRLDTRIGRLTSAQSELLQRIAAGKTNREIAVEFGVCVRTIENRRSLLMETVDAHSLTELLRLAVYVQNGDDHGGGDNGHRTPRFTDRERSERGRQVMVPATHA